MQQTMGKTEGFSGADDESQIRAFLSGDEGAFEQLVDRHQRAVLRLCQRLVLNEDLARDLFQEVFLQVYRSLGSLRQPAAFRSWLYRLVLRKAQRMRRQRGEEELATQPADTSSGAAAKAEHQEEIELVQRCLERLPPRQREVVVLRQLQELTYQEIAAILGIREDAARANHYQALQRLRQELRPHLP